MLGLSCPVLSSPVTIDRPSINTPDPTKGLAPAPPLSRQSSLLQTRYSSLSPKAHPNPSTTSNINIVALSNTTTSTHSRTSHTMAEIRRKLVIVGDGACGKTCLLMYVSLTSPHRDCLCLCLPQPRSAGWLAGWLAVSYYCLRTHRRRVRLANHLVPSSTASSPRAPSLRYGLLSL